MLPPLLWWKWKNSIKTLSHWAFFAREKIDLLLFWRLGSLTIQFRDVYGTLEPPSNINVFLLNPLLCADETTGNFLAIKLSARGRTVKMQSIPCTSVINRFQLRVQCDSHWSSACTSSYSQQMAPELSQDSRNSLLSWFQVSWRQQMLIGRRRKRRWMFLSIMSILECNIFELLCLDFLLMCLHHLPTILQISQCLIYYQLAIPIYLTLMHLDVVLFLSLFHKVTQRLGVAWQNAPMM